MCTVSIVPHDDGFRMACNRDERRTRPPALAPSFYGLNHRTAAFPVDAQGGGTWIGVNDAGLTIALLNRPIGPAAPMRNPRWRSRGLIIPTLLGCGSLADALEAATMLNPADFDLFRLVVACLGEAEGEVGAQNTEVAVVTSNGIALSAERRDVSRPLMLTSSSLGDAVVEAPRRRLFEQLMIGDDRGWLAGQSRFHRHQWPWNTHISVSMARSDALTVSRTFIDVSSRGIDLRYEPVGPLCGSLRESCTRVTRIAVLGARSAPRDTDNQPRALPGYQRRSP